MSKLRAVNAVKMLSGLLEFVSVVPLSPVHVPLLFLHTADAGMCAAYARAKAAIPATTAATLLPTATTFAAPLKVVGVAVVEDVDEVDEEDEEVVVTLDAVAAGVVELPAGKGTGATVGMVAKAVEDVAGVEATTGVGEVTRVLVEELEVELDEDEAIEAEPPTGPALPVHG